MVGGAAAGGGGQAGAAGGAQPPERDGGGRRLPGRRNRARGGGGGASDVRRRPAPARAGGRPPRGALDQRLQGHQRRLGGGGAALVPRAGASDRRRPRQGPGLPAAGAAGGRALRRRLSDRGGGRGAGRGAGRHGGARAPGRGSGSGGGGGPAGGRPRRGRAALARLRQLRPVPRLRGSRRALPRAGRGAAVSAARPGQARAAAAGAAARTASAGAAAQTASSRAATGRAAAGGAARTSAPGGPGSPRAMTAERAASRPAPPLEHRMLTTATLCLLAFGAVMVYSASSPIGVLSGRGGSGTSEFLRYLIFAALGVGAMQLLARRGLTLLDRRLVNLLLAGAFGLLLIVLVPGFGVQVNGARRWFAAGPIQFQPSEVMKLALVLYVARYLAEHPRRLRGLRQALAPSAVVAGPAILLIVVEPDLGTALVVAFTVAALLVAAGLRPRQLAALAALAAGCVLLLAVAQPYERARLTSFLHPWAAATKAGAGYQAVQGQIALGSGGLFGVGLGKSVQKTFYLPEAQTDFILAVIGEELGVVGIFGVVFLYGMVAYAGLRTARRAAGRYEKLLASGLTSLILCQGILNIFVVLGLAPLTGVPLPFISYAPTNLCIMLAAVGLLLNIAHPRAGRLRLVHGTTGERAAGRDRRRRDRRARRAGAGGGRLPER